MADPAPSLRLSHGQVLWCLSGGRAPVPPMQDQVRYLRQLGIPFEEEELGQGRGVRLYYDFYQFIEVAVAQMGLRFRIQPRFLTMLVEDRRRYRNLYREAYQELAANRKLFEEPSGRSQSIFQDEFYLRFHDRYSDTPGTIRPVLKVDSNAAQKFGNWVESYEGQPDRDVIALKSFMLDLLRLARDAPQTKPGPSG